MAFSRNSLLSVESDSGLPVTLGKISPTPRVSPAASASTARAGPLKGPPMGLSGLCPRPWNLPNLGKQVYLSPLRQKPESGDNMGLTWGNRDFLGLSGTI